MIQHFTTRKNGLLTKSTNIEVTVRYVSNDIETAAVRMTRMKTTSMKTHRRFLSSPSITYWQGFHNERMNESFWFRIEKNVSNNLRSFDKAASNMRKTCYELSCNK